MLEQTSSNLENQNLMGLQGEGSDPHASAALAGRCRAGQIVRTGLALSLVWLLVIPAPAQRPQGPQGVSKLARFVASHRKSDGSFGPPGLLVGEARWTWWALRSLKLAGLAIKDGQHTARTLRSWSPAGAAREAKLLALRQSCRLLGASPPSPPSLPGVLAALPPLALWIGSPPLDSLETAARLRQDLGDDAQEGPLVAHYLSFWRGADGGYAYPAPLKAVFGAVRLAAVWNKLPKHPGQPSSMGATAAAVGTLLTLKQPVPEKQRVVAWIQTQCEPSGGYRNRPGELGEATLKSCFDALRTLRALGAPVAHGPKTRAWILQHWQASGGFGFGPNEPPSLEATWLALEGLHLLGYSLAAGSLPAGGAGRLPSASDPGGLSLFQAAIEIGPDPGVTVMLARRFGAELVLIKGKNEPLLARRAQRIAKDQGLPLVAACAREEHRQAWGLAGLGYVTHCSDLIFDPAHPLKKRDCYSGWRQIVHAWQPDQEQGALVFSCSYLHPALLAPAYDRSLAGDGGYNALMGTWAFSPDGDLPRDFPWLLRYQGRLPMLGNHDAHGDPFHWLFRGLRTRTLFFAKSPKLVSFREAVMANRVVAVAQGHEHTALYGHPYWVARAWKEQARWDLGRPKQDREPWLPAPLALAVGDASAFMLPFLKKGRALLVRAAEHLGDDALPFEMACQVDGRPVKLALVPPALSGPPALWAPLPGLAAGDHMVSLQAFGRHHRQRLHFGAPLGPLSERASDPLPKPPSSLSFKQLREILFIRAALSTADMQGSVLISSNRADFFLTPPPGGAHELRVSFWADAVVRRAEIFLEGRSLGNLLQKARHGTLHLALPPGKQMQGPLRITIRSNLPPWIPSFTVLDRGLHLTRLALLPAGKGR